MEQLTENKHWHVRCEMCGEMRLAYQNNDPRNLCEVCSRVVAFYSQRSVEQGCVLGCTLVVLQIILLLVPLFFLNIDLMFLCWSAGIVFFGALCIASFFFCHKSFLFRKLLAIGTRGRTRYKWKPQNILHLGIALVVTGFAVWYFRGLLLLQVSN